MQRAPHHPTIAPITSIPYTPTLPPLVRRRPFARACSVPHVNARTQRARSLHLKAIASPASRVPISPSLTTLPLVLRGSVPCSTASTRRLAIDFFYLSEAVYPVPNLPQKPKPVAFSNTGISPRHPPPAAITTLVSWFPPTTPCTTQIVLRQQPSSPVALLCSVALAKLTQEMPGLPYSSLLVQRPQIPLNFFDPGSSSTASLVSCSDQRCSSGIQVSDSTCSGSSNQCSYTFQYGDGSGTSGYYVSDLLHFNTILPGHTTGNATASIMFGCSMLHTGKLTDSHRAVDGIFGFGQQSLSVISQLSSQRVTPRTFSHCLKGNDDGGGILVLGEIVEPDMVYTPLVPSMYVISIHLIEAVLLFIYRACYNCSRNDLFTFSGFWNCQFLSHDSFVLSYELHRSTVFTRSLRPKLMRIKHFCRPHYNIDLRSISVGGQVLSIDASVFSTSINHGAIIDSGTTLSYLADEAYNAFIDAINNAVSEHVHPVLSHGNQCYLITDSIDHIFPEASLNFAGGAALILHPEDYLIQQNPIGGSAVWCIGFKTIEGQKLTILGDLVMKDKIFVYDLEKQQIGWVNYDCSSSVNVSVNTEPGKTKFVNARPINNSSSPDELQTTVALLLNMFMLAAIDINLMNCLIHANVMSWTETRAQASVANADLN
ncbi:hypothetical protein GOBAR_AA32010 [Gossypium barbadense]|uniref:Peptidase A1 domain-containing protein n=1 Tax=Gossypium barbadense TaxID=3634 RepID=A0A2P5WC52_GOSBA|nr:hypothetical protein GOBAR_AA32010 [Gossypium barbadense]